MVGGGHCQCLGPGSTKAVKRRVTHPVARLHQCSTNPHKKAFSKVLSAVLKIPTKPDTGMQTPTKRSLSHSENVQLLQLRNKDWVFEGIYHWKDMYGWCLAIHNFQKWLLSLLTSIECLNVTLYQNNKKYHAPMPDICSFEIFKHKDHQHLIAAGHLMAAEFVPICHESLPLEPSLKWWHRSFFAKVKCQTHGIAVFIHFQIGLLSMRNAGQVIAVTAMWRSMLV